MRSVGKAKRTNSAAELASKVPRLIGRFGEEIIFTAVYPFLEVPSLPR
jgi:hypothetical protein